jgi:hypothetical protein
MEFGNIGGFALILAGLVWLAVFVPSWARRSELRAIEENSKNYARATRPAPTREAKLARTRSVFALIATASVLGGTGLVFLSQVSPWLLAAVIAIGAASLLIATAANRSLNQLVASGYEARQQKREQVSRRLEQTSVASGWTPNPLPQPLNAPKRGELIAPDAEVIPLVRASRPQDSAPLNGNEIVEILKRRRVI